MLRGRHLLRHALMFIAALPVAACVAPSPRPQPRDPWGDALERYVDTVRKEPLQYERIDTQTFGGTRVSRFELLSQHWSPAQASEPAEWRHEVRLFVPADANHGTAILVVNDGTRHPLPGGEPSPPRNWSEAALRELAEKTNGIVVEIGDVPNQYLRGADGTYRKEDQAVAHSWKLAMEGGDSAPFASLHLPMAAATVRAMDLAQRELEPWGIRHFIVTGASKRGWATWLAALGDDRVSAIAPVAIDVLDTADLIERTRKTYGGHWPVAFHDYRAAGVLRERHTPAFTDLMRLEDPLAYLDTRRGRERLSIPKYLISASGDDFFLPDHLGRTLPRLPGPVAVRALPNSDHGGVTRVLPDAVVPFIKRIMAGTPLPRLTRDIEGTGDATSIHVTMNERPVALTRWTANNGKARDFRFACDVRYEATTIAPARDLHLSLSASPGWTATFLEATFADGLVVTTPVDVWPDDAYPEAPPATTTPSCSTLPED